MSLHTSEKLLAAPETEINDSNIRQILETESPSSPFFTKAVEYLRTIAIKSNQITPLREIIPLNTSLDRKFIDWLSLQTYLSRARNAQTDSRTRIALTAWLLGSPNGTLFTKTNEEYSFVQHIRSLLVSWEVKSAEEQELIVLKIKMLLNLIINSMEVRLPNPSSHDELREIYQAVLKLIESIQKQYSKLDTAGESRAHSSIGASAISDYEKQDLLGKEMIFFQASFHSIYLIQLHGWTGRDEIRCHRAIVSIQTHLISKNSSEELKALYNTTHTFRLNRGRALAAGGEISGIIKEKSLLKMIETFYDLYYRRLHYNILDERKNSEERDKLQKIIMETLGEYSVEKFINELKKYHPHKSTDYTIDLAAHQAELDTFTHTLKALPDDAVEIEVLRCLLSNIIGNSSEKITYHPLDNCQGYVLAIIDEILRRLCVPQINIDQLDDENMKRFIFSIKHLEVYMHRLPHHPMHVHLSGSIYIRLANLYVRFRELQKSISEAEDSFIKGYKSFYSQGNQSQKLECIKMSTIFLKKYLAVVDSRQAIDSGTKVTRAPAFLPPIPEWESRIALAILLDSHNFRNYETILYKKISEKIENTVISIEIAGREKIKKQKSGEYISEFLGSAHYGIIQLFESVSEIINSAYDGIFNVKIARANRHMPRMGDFKISDEISIGFGFTAIIEYPLENAGMIEHKFISGTNSPDDIYKLLTGVVTRQLREFIIRISNPKVLSNFLTHAERRIQEQQNKSTQGYIDLDKYAMFHQIFIQEPDNLVPLIYHQKKFKNHTAVGSEILVRFQNPDFGTQKLLPLDEAFAFLDLFEQYKIVSRKIIANAMQIASQLGQPFSINIKCEELEDHDFSTFILDLLAKVNRTTGNGITLEILESSALDPENGNVLMNLKNLKAKGFHFALDDFRGTDADYDKFNKLRMIRIPKDPLLSNTTTQGQNLTYVEVDDIKNHTYIESKLLNFDDLDSTDKIETPKDIPIFGEGDEIKFDYINKETLSLIHRITMNWPENKITLKEISRHCENDITSPVLRLVNLISYCKYYHIKYTIEQVRDAGEDHILRIANLLGFIVQGFYYHKPSQMIPKKEDHDEVNTIRSQLTHHIDLLL